ncbi:MAG: MFS transporter [Pseudonocardiaceae bacterium]|nr:MFS transporter [Pseudonocardiaceae bacterium]
MERLGRPAASGPRQRPWLTLTAVCLGGAAVGLDGTAVTIAAPHIARSVGASLGDLQWIANSYLIALAIGLLPSGRLADRIGRRRTFAVGVIGFGLTSLAIALSTGVTALILFRALQGFAGALLQPASLALIRAVFPVDRLGVALGLWGGANALAIGLGPVVAGVIVQGFDWPAVFLLNVPIAVITTALIYLAVGESKGPSMGLAAPLWRLLRARAVSVAASVLVLSSFGVFGLLFMLTLYLQNVHGFQPITAGLWLLPPIGIVVISAPIGGVLTERFGSRWPVAGGLLLMAAGLFGLAQLTADSNFWDMVRPAVLVGFGTGLCAVSATQSIMGAAPDSMTGMASAIQQTASQIGGMLGIGLMGWMMSARVLDALPQRINEAHLPAQLGFEMRRGVDDVAQGMVPETSAPGGGPVAGAVRTVTDLVFTDGMGAAFLLAAGVILLGVLLAMLLRTSRPAAHQAAGPPDAPADVHGERGHQQGANDQGVEQHAEGDQERDLDHEQDRQHG